MLPVTIQGKHYKSIAEAWRELSPKTLKLITLRLRLRNGWDVEDAFLTPPIPPQERRAHKNNRI